MTANVTDSEQLRNHAVSPGFIKIKERGVANTVTHKRSREGVGVEIFRIRQLFVELLTSQYGSCSLVQNYSKHFERAIYSHTAHA